MKRNTVVLLLISAVLLLLFSCDLVPLDDELLIQVQDDQPPIVVITSPEADSFFYSTVTITGEIYDSAIEANDNNGIIESVSFTVLNDASRRGRVVRQEDGSYAADPLFGTGNITFDQASGVYTIIFSSIEVDGVPSLITQRVNVSISAVDGNNQETTADIRLLESDGPNIILYEPGTTKLTFNPGDLIEVTGTAGNSFLDPDNADEIAEVMWRVPNQAWAGILDTTAASSDWDGGRGVFVTDNIGFQYPAEFTFDPATQEFYTSFTVPTNFTNVSLIPVEVRATDLNGNENLYSVNLFTDAAGPLVDFTLPPTGTGIYNTGSAFFVRPDTSFNIAYSTSDTISLMEYTLPPNVSSFTAFSPFTSPLNVPSSAISEEDITLTIRATKDNGNESLYYFNIYADGTGPQISVTDFYQQGTPGDYYVRPGQTVILNFTAADQAAGTASGIDASLTPQVTIDGQTAVNTGQYQYEYTFPAGPPAERTVNFSIGNIGDNVGTISAVTQSGIPANEQIQFYSGSGTLTNFSISTSNTDPAWAKQGDVITIEFDSSRDLSGDPAVLISGNAAAVSGPVSGTYTAVYQMGASDSETDIPYYITFTDAAGNTGNTVDDYTGIEYDRTAPGTPAFTNPAPGILTNNPTPTWTWSSVSGADYYEYRYDGGAWTGNGASTSFTPAVPITDHDDYELLVRACDDAGNTSSSVSRTIEVDTVPPGNPAFTGPATLTNSTSVTWTWGTAADADSYEYSYNDGVWQNVGTDQSLTLDSLTHGDHKLEVRAVDEAGNVSASPDTRTVTVDLLPPGNPVFTAPSSPINQASFDLEWSSATDADTYEYRYESGNWTDIGNKLFYTVGSFIDGTQHDFSIRAVDAAGNVSVTPAQITIDIDLSPPGDPILSGPSSPTAQDTFTINWTAAADADRYEYRIDTGSWEDAGTGTSCTVGPLTHGTRDIYLRAVDEAGNVSVTPGNITIDVDLEGPNPPDVTSGSPTVSAGSDIPWTWLTGGNGGSGNYRYKVNDTNLESGATATTDEFFTASGYSAGDYTLYVQEADDLGNWSDSGSYMVTVLP